MMSQLYEVLGQKDEQTSRRLLGVVVGVVTDNKDLEKMGRVKVRFPCLNDQDESNWARICSLMAGKGRGAYFLPEIDDEVLIAFEHGDRRFPYVLGALWNGKDVPPETNSDGKNDVRLIQSRSGHVIRFNDADGKETIEILDKGGNSIIFDTASNSLTIASKKDITLSAPQGTITLDAQTIEIKASTQATLQAGSTMDVKANATMNIKGAVVNIN